MRTQRIERYLAQELAKAKKDGAAGVQRFFMATESALAAGQMRVEEFSVRNLFQELVPNGRELMESWHGSVNGGYAIQVLEAAGAVDTSVFANISGQLLGAQVLEEWNSPELIWRDLVTIRSTRFNGEKIIGISPASDEIDTVEQGGLYGAVGLSEKYVETPQLVKKGATIALTREAVLHDNTNSIMQRAQSIAEAMALNIEKRILDMVFGITNTYKRNGAAVANSYLSSGAYVNIAASNGLRDFTNIDAALQLFEDMTDPETGEPIVVSPNVLIVPTALKMSAGIIAGASQIHRASGAGFLGDQLKNPDVMTIAPNPIKSPLAVLSNAYVKARTSSASTWFIGNPKKAFELREGWPIEVRQAPPNNPAEFDRDIVSSWKVSHYGVPATVEPRHMVKCTA